MSYKIQFLNDEEFNQLPGQYMDTKLGVAYPESGEAYVRQTGIKAVDLFNLAHELEHLEGKDLDEHYDAENKCYYKDFGQTLQTVAPALSFIPGIGPIAAAGAGIGGGLLHNRSVDKANKAAMSQQQGMMSQFSQEPQVSQATGPNVIQGGGAGGPAGASGSGGGNGLIDRLRSILGRGANTQFGNYAGR